MLINLSDIIKDYGGRLELSESFKMPETQFLGEDFTFPEDCLLSGAILNNTKSLELKAEVKGKMCVHCARCQKPLTVAFSFPISEVLVREDAEFSEEDEVLVYSGNEIDLTEAIIDSFLMSVSSKYLCKEDCKGLCPKCGTDLNESSCDCDLNVIDPRLEKLAEIMKNMSDTE